MKNNLSAALSFLLLLGLVYYSFYTHKPQKVSDINTPLTEFSTARALVHLEKITAQPHAVSTAGHTVVRDYIIEVLELMGLEVQTQQGMAYKPGWGAMSQATNIISRIKGSGDGKAVLLMSHYDSAPHTASYGAGDAGSGVVAVLESVRAFIAQGTIPVNDIIILFTDAEELGLNGASVFVNEHPWAKDVGVALNFEARGSGGPSSMIVETNGGNSELIKAFAKANPSHPYANSLMYSVYKLLPNDTDSTVLREAGDIDGFFFAFIGDHFDYHTAMDRYERLDRESLEHQGEYLMPLIAYFSETPLDLKGTEDYIYFNVPLVKMVYYPFNWIWPLLILAWITFIAVIIYGLKGRRFTLGQIGRGFLPLLILLVLAFILGKFGWGLIAETIHPEYVDILHGFTYNGYAYIVAFVALMLAICFYVYKLFQKPDQAASLSIAPLFFWLIISTAVAVKLPGAAFFVIPVLFGILSVFLILKNNKINLFWVTLLAAPAIFILTHYIKEFPVGLGLKMMFAATVLTVLLFAILLPVIGFYRFRGKIAILFLIVAVGSFIKAEKDATFTEDRPFPTSLNYVYNVDQQKAYWATFNQYPNDWLLKTLGENPEKAAAFFTNQEAGKYKSSYTYAKEASIKAVAPSSIYKAKDTVIGTVREIRFVVYPQREINDMVLMQKPGTPYTQLIFNDHRVEKKPTEDYIFSERTSSKLLSYRVTDREPLTVNLKVPAGTPIQFTLYDYSYDLLDNPAYKVPQRPINSIPMPFIYTDAIITEQTISFD